jgi:DNA-binding transcriptional LysR family regulator
MGASAGIRNFMTLEQLRIFVAVAEREHVTRAAEALGLTQSTASAAIAALEHRHGAALFHRVGRGIELTGAGRLFVAEAKGVLARAEAAERMLADLGDLRTGTLALHASQTIASYWLPRHLVRFHAAYPAIEIKLTIGNTAQAAAAIIAGAAELGFIEGAIDEPALSYRRVGDDHLVLVAGADYPVPGKGGLMPEALLAQSWVLRERGSGTRSELEAALRQRGIDPTRLRIALELPSNESVRAAIEAGAGIGAISELAVEAGLRAGTLQRLPFDLPLRPFNMLLHLERYRSKAAEAFMAGLGAAASRPSGKTARR